MWETFDPIQQKISRFELETILALELFVRADLDVVILEAGLGGKRDATSAVTPDVVGLTSIELEHTEILGPKLEDIAKQKVGGIRIGVPLVSAPLPPAATDVVTSLCQMREAPITWIGKNTQDKQNITVQDVTLHHDGCTFTLSYFGQSWDTKLSMLGKHIPILTATAVGIVSALLQSLGQRFLPQTLESLQTLQIPGRLQRAPLPSPILLDVAHTPASVHNAVVACQQLKQKPPKAVLLGLNEDKRVNELLHILAQETKILILVPNPGPRGCSTQLLREALSNTTWVYSAPNVEIYDTVEQGWNALTQHIKKHHVGLALGSFRLIGAIQEILNLPPLPQTHIDNPVREESMQEEPMTHMMFEYEI